MYNKDFEVVSRFETEVYKEDLIGIRTLEEDGRADFTSIPKDHMHFAHSEIIQNIEGPFSH